MMKRILTFPVLLILITAGYAMAQEISAVDILTSADSIANAPRDQYMATTMVLVDSDGETRERQMIMYQKGSEKRLVRFLSPADQRGISFLSLPDDVMYLYLPAFRKIRMIASHVKNQNFAGTDFSYDDMSSFKFSEEYDPELLETLEDSYLLKLTPKEGMEKDYGKLNVWIKKAPHLMVRVEYYDKAGNLWKVMTREQYELTGIYWAAKVMEIRDVKKNHATRMLIEEVEYDSDQSEDIYTKRNLQRFR